MAQTCHDAGAPYKQPTCTHQCVYIARAKQPSELLYHENPHLPSPLNKPTWRVQQVHRWPISCQPVASFGTHVRVASTPSKHAGISPTILSHTYTLSRAQFTVQMPTQPLPWTIYEAYYCTHAGPAPRPSLASTDRLPQQCRSLPLPTSNNAASKQQYCKAPNTTYVYPWHSVPADYSSSPTLLVVARQSCSSPSKHSKTGTRHHPHLRRHECKHLAQP